MDITVDQILDYWCSERMTKQWFGSTQEIDEEIEYLDSSDAFTG